MDDYSDSYSKEEYEKPLENKEFPKLIETLIQQLRHFIYDTMSKNQSLDPSLVQSALGAAFCNNSAFMIMQNLSELLKDTCIGDEEIDRIEMAGMKAMIAETIKLAQGQEDWRE